MRLTLLRREDGLEVDDFVVSILNERDEHKFQLLWSQLLLLPPLVEAIANDCRVEFTENELTELEREGWLLLISNGKYPTQWRPPSHVLPQ